MTNTIRKNNIKYYQNGSQNVIQNYKNNPRKHHKEKQDVIERKQTTVKKAENPRKITR